MASARRRLLLSEHDPVRMREAHNNLDDAVLKAEDDVGELQDDVADLVAAVEDLDTAATAIANASTSHALNAVFSDTEVEAALDALAVKINAILAALQDLA